MSDSNVGLNKLASHYSQTYRKYGFNSEGADWGDKERHHLRIRSMINLLGQDAFENCSILDLGCGYGSLLSILQSYYPAINFGYVGVDPCKEAIDFARSNSSPSAEFICSDIQSFSSEIGFDTVFCCGVFTKKAEMSDDEMYHLLSVFFSLIKDIRPSHVCFNAMSPFCDRIDDDIFYPSTEKIFGMITRSFGYSTTDFCLSNSHLKFEMLWRFSLQDE